MPGLIFRNALRHPRQLCGGGVGLALLPVGVGHAVNRFPRHVPWQIPGFGHPVRQAVAAKPGQPHQVDVRCIRPVAQMRDEAAERSCRHGIGNFSHFFALA